MALIRRSALSEADSGKALSDGWALNFAVGCTHGCLFCYVQRIAALRVPPEARRSGWGSYLYVEEGLERKIRETPWWQWRGRTVLMSSTHDPYLPEVYFPHRWPRRILEAALPHGVSFNILTRSVLALQDLDIFVKYREQVRLMYSLPSLDGEFVKLTEPRAPPPSARLIALRKAKEAGARIGVVIAPIIPRPGWQDDLEAVFEALAGLRPEVVFGEALHSRGSNLAEMRRRGVAFWTLTKELDLEIGAYFEYLLERYGLAGRYWYEWLEKPVKRSRK